MLANDNDFAARGAILPSTDSHGLAALLLVESLIHGLCEKSILSAGEAVEITERAVEVQFDQAEEAGGAGAPMWRSHGLLVSISLSLAADDNAGVSPPRLIS